MAKKLLIVESPSKIKTIQKMLDSDYIIDASYGHVIDLPKTTLGIDVKNGYKPRYKVLKDKQKIIEKLLKEAKKVDKVYLASDPDREGEAIAWHISNVLKMPDKIERIEFNEITKTAILKAIENPRKINKNLVDAQQTRRILDRMVGYKISPLLWKKVHKTASAGRVQSVSLKIVCDREDEIKNFVSVKYYDISLLVDYNIKLNLSKVDNKIIDKFTDEEKLEKLKKLFKDKKIEVDSVEIKTKKQQPPLAFKTSTLQQTASSRLGYSPSRTMRIAQQLYESGYITYMRTDSTRLSDEARKQAKAYISKKYGAEYTSKGRFVNSKHAQDAHEAIRPTDVNNDLNSVSFKLSVEQYKLYELIFQRFIISQFSPVEYDQLKIIAKKEEFEFRGIINKIKHQGFYLIYKDEDSINTEDFPDINNGDILKVKKFESKENMTTPPARYTEASLVKKLETEEIGRPSTYATILETLKKRKYVELEAKKLVPTNLGYQVKNELDKNFNNIMNIKFTANLEKYLDDIESGNLTMLEVIDTFYKSLEKEINKYSETIENIKNKKIYTDVLCSDNNHSMLYKIGIYGAYLVCEIDEKEKIKIPDLIISEEEIESGFLHIKHRLSPADVKKTIETDLQTDDGHPYVIKKGPYGFYLESINYQNDKLRKTLDKKIQNLIEKNMISVDDNGKYQLKVLMQSEIDEDKKLIESAGLCEKCGHSFVIKKSKFGKFLACSNYPKCKNIKKINKGKK